MLAQASLEATITPPWLHVASHTDIAGIWHIGHGDVVRHRTWDTQNIWDQRTWEESTRGMGRKIWGKEVFLLGININRYIAKYKCTGKLTKYLTKYVAASSDFISISKLSRSRCDSGCDSQPFTPQGHAYRKPLSKLTCTRARFQRTVVVQPKTITTRCGQ